LSVKLKQSTANGEGMKMGISAAQLESIISITSAPIHNIKNTDWLFSNQLPSYVIFIGVWTLF
jgi:hypothetical protein